MLLPFSDVTSALLVHFLLNVLGNKKWTNSALVTSLNGRSIYRVNFQDDKYDKILYLEKIYIGERIRDIKYVEKLNVIIIALETTGNIGILKNIFKFRSGNSLS